MAKYRIRNNLGQKVEVWFGEQRGWRTLKPKEWVHDVDFLTPQMETMIAHGRLRVRENVPQAKAKKEKKGGTD